MFLMKFGKTYSHTIYFIIYKVKVYSSKNRKGYIFVKQVSYTHYLLLYSVYESCDYIYRVSIKSR